MRFGEARIPPGVGASPCAREHPILLSLLVDALSTGDVFLDVGANTGFFAVPLAKLVGDDGHVLAFEPAADAVRRLRSEARAQAVLSRISIYEMALGSDDSVLVLRADPDDPQNWTKRSLFIDDGPVVGDVPVRSLDGLVYSGAIPLPRGIDAVKIDVEGGEIEVLRGMRASLERYRPRMMVIETIESHLRRAGSTVSDVHSFMGGLGYVPLREGPGVERLELNAVFVPA